jgi:hypothetical protein
MTKWMIGAALMMGAGVALFAGACEPGHEGGTDVGTEGGPCTGQGTCDPGLTCLSKRCVKSQGGPPSGSGGAPGGDPVTAFIGNWKYTSGTSAAQCTGNTETKQLVGAFFRLRKGTDAALVFGPENTNCNLKLDLEGMTASFRPGTSCSFADGGASFKLEAGEGGTIVSTSPNNAIVGFAGMITATGATTVVCTYTINGTATRVSTD